MIRHHTCAVALAIGAGLALLAGAPATTVAAVQDYRFELSGQPQQGPGGRSIVSVRLVHVPDAKPVTDAVVFESTADMGPAGMPTMTGPIKALPAQADVYRFEVEPGMAGKWALNLAAKVQGETGTVRGTVTVDLVK